ncbi:spaetzle-processing enzyme-like [Drosophila gunungcola]|uniref:spaetzle-processing enzyme-like n=1 Tax=Drosophila gunungcola TaxID=103775 RepID=UPI0022E47792|nr:spaetzle-processing enzyme-like [Drosophila gunungcola]
MRNAPSLDHCPHLWNIIEERGLTSSVHQMLRQRICSPDPDPLNIYSRQSYICCPKPAYLLPNNMTCGQGPPDFRFTDSKEAFSNQFPWMALLIYRNILTWKPSPNSVCEGSLINNRYVLTAAHCVVSGWTIYSDLVLKSVRLGEHDITTNPDCTIQINGRKTCAPPHLEIDVENIIVHPAFGSTSKFQNDIALLRLEMPVRYTKEIRPICVLGGIHYFSNSRLELAGWGKMKTNVTPTVLMKNMVKSSSTCPIMYRDFNFWTQFCALDKRDPCGVTSGGVLMATKGRGFEEFTYVAGISSYGHIHCGYPEVFTKIGPFVGWIKRQLGP